MIELLVTVTILGVLSAISLPSFLNQVDKASSTEGRSNSGAILRAQQSYRYNNGTFASSLDDLQMTVQQKNYQYAILAGSNSQFVEIRANPQNNDFRVYAGGVEMKSDASFDIILCESKNVLGASGNADVLSPGLQCDSDSIEIE